MAKLSPAITYDWSVEPVLENVPMMPEKLFEVTCVVGVVYSGGDESPRMAAMRLIVEHDADGEYTFPNEDGSIVRVGIITENPPK